MDSSRQESVVFIMNERPPRCRPRTMRPSLRYCSIGSQNKSRTPNTATKHVRTRLERWKLCENSLKAMLTDLRDELHGSYATRHLCHLVLDDVVAPFLNTQRAQLRPASHSARERRKNIIRSEKHMDLNPVLAVRSTHPCLWQMALSVTLELLSWARPATKF